MRTNGDGGERFLARFSAEESASQRDEAEDVEDAKPGDRPGARTLVDAAPAGSKAPKSRMKKGSSRSQAPKSHSSAEVSPVVATPSKRPPAKRGERGKTKSIAPEPRRSRRPPASKEVAAASVTPPVSVPPVSPPPVSAPPSLDPRTTLRDHPVQKSAAKAARAATSSRRDDEASIPPTSSDPPGELDDRFFAEGEAAAHAAHAETKLSVGTMRSMGSIEIDDLDAGRPVVIVPPERRKRLANYVKTAVGFSAVLLLAGFARVGLSHALHSSESGPGERSAAAAQVVLAAPPVAAPAPPPPVAIAEPPAAAVAEPVVAVPEEPAAPVKSAKQEKEDARAALEHGKRKDAIDGAQRSVDLDPTDAEAWLILGSAQQDSGHWKDARESFVQCTKQAKTGPVNECGMMLR